MHLDKVTSWNNKDLPLLLDQKILWITFRQKASQLGIRRTLSRGTSSAGGFSAPQRQPFHDDDNIVISLFSAGGL
jgi:hypothetical protein